MPGKSKADRKAIPEEKMTAEEKDVDRMLRQDITIARKIKQIERHMKAESALLRQQIREKEAGHEEELNDLGEKRKDIRNAILEFWKRHHDNITTLEFPSAMVSRRDYRELVIHCRIALVNALDIAGRLDLVDYVFDEKKIARLIAQGKLQALPGDAVEVKDHFNLQVRPRK